MPKTPETLHSRPPLERIQRIMALIQRGEYPNCRSIADELEMSTRTIKRDLDFMKYRLNLPIEYDQRRYGYYFTKPVEELPGIPITEAEMFALFVAHKAVAQYRGTPFENPLETAFRKLTSQLGKQALYSLGNLEQALSFRPFAPDDIDLETFQQLTQGAQLQRVVQFDYRGLGAQRSEPRTIHPYHVACVDNRWYVIAYDVQRKGMRTFALSRIKRVKVLARTFTRPADFNANEYLKGSFGIFKAGDDFEVVIHFDAWAGQLITERQWHASQELTPLPGGGTRLRLRLNNIEEVERWILSWGVHATVIRPQALIDRIAKIGAELVRRYQS